MHDIHMATVSREFAECWSAAGRHLDAQMQGASNSWLKATLSPPFLEHLSFRLGNQLFFIRLEDAQGSEIVPGSREGLLAIARGCRGVACLMSMRREGETWRPAQAGWGLVSLADGSPVVPPDLVTDELIEMTDWELQDFAVQIVRHQLEGAGRRMMSWQGNPAVDPSLWFVGDDGPEWVLVRAARWPAPSPGLPANAGQVAERCAAIGRRGHFASLVVASGRQQSAAADSEMVITLWRGHQLAVEYAGLRSVPPAH